MENLPLFKVNVFYYWAGLCFLKFILKVGLGLAFILVMLKAKLVHFTLLL